MSLPEAPNSILVICTRRIGDVVLVTPVMRSLKTKWPNAQIHVLVFEKTEGALENNPDVARVIAVKRRGTRKERLTEAVSLWRKYDIAYSVTQSDRASFYCWIGGRYRLGIVASGKKNLAKRILFHRRLVAPPETHTVSVALMGLGLLGVEPVHQVVPPSISVHAPLAAGLDDLLKPLEDRPFVALQVDVMYRYKAWHAAGWTELIAWLRPLGYRVVLSGGTRATHNADVAAVRQGAGPDVVDLVGRVSLAELAAVIGRAALYVSVDTGVSHIAAATATPIIVLFGPSNPIAWGPWPVSWRQHENPWRLRGSRSIGNVFLLQGSGACVPCLKEGCERHQQSHSDCLSLLNARTVNSAAATMLGLRDAVPDRGSESAPNPGHTRQVLWIEKDNSSGFPSDC
jgi:heptosyltransferase III